MEATTAESRNASGYDRLTSGGALRLPRALERLALRAIFCFEWSSLGSWAPVAFALASPEMPSGSGRSSDGGLVDGVSANRPVRSAPVLAKASPTRQACRAGLLERLGMGRPESVVLGHV